MTISPVATSQPSGAPTAAQSAQTQSAQGASALSSDFETFLHMLSVQMRNQDPLNPTDSSEYAVQLATFSSVEQQVFTNDLLTLMSSQMGAMGMSSLASWIGMEARITGPASFTGNPVEVVPYVEPLADEAHLIVRDADGVEVQRYAIDTTDDPLHWKGVDDTGKPFDPGLYRFEVESRSHGKVLQTHPADVYTRISEARGGLYGTTLIASGEVEFLSSDVVSLREPR